MALSEWDKKHLDANQQRAVLTYTAEWEKAKRAGDTARMEWAHNGAEAIRRQAGYSGGDNGGSFAPAKSTSSASTNTSTNTSATKPEGISGQDWAYRQQQKQQTSTTSTSKPSNQSTQSSDKGYDNGSLTKDQVKTLQKALGVEQDGFFGPKTQAAAFQRWGTSSADAAMKYYNTPTTPARTSFSFDEDEGIYHWNGQSFTTKADLTAAMNKADLSAAEKNIVDRKATNSGAGVQLQGGSFRSTTPEKTTTTTTGSAKTGTSSTYKNPLAPGGPSATSPSAQQKSSSGREHSGSGQSLDEPRYLEAPEEEENEKQGFFARLIGTVKGGGKGSAASNTNAMANLYELGQGARDTMNAELAADYKRSLDQAQHAMDLMRADPTTDPRDIKSQQNIIDDLQRKYDAVTKAGDIQRGATQETYRLADEIQQSSAADIAQAKKGLNKFGQMVVDAGASMTQVGLDAAANAAIGAQTMLPFALRAYGGGTQEARQNGADAAHAALYGTAQAAKEVFTEKMFNLAAPFSKAYGGGSMDDAVKSAIGKAVEKLAKTEAGEKLLGGALTLGASAASEGLEELIGDWMEWQLPRIYGGNVDSAADTLAKSLYDFAVGGISGLMGGAVDGETYNYAKPASGNAAKTTAAAEAVTKPAPKTEAKARAQIEEPLYIQTAEEIAAETPTTPASVNGARTATAQAGNLTPAQSRGAEAQISPQSAQQPSVVVTGPDSTSAESMESKTAKSDSYRAEFPAEQHIDNRDMDSVKARGVNAFQFDHPELHQYYVNAAQALIADADASLSQPNSRQRVRGVEGRKFNQSAQTSPQLRSAMDDANLTRGQIIDAAERIVNNHGQENVAAAKRLELILDDMLSNGYTTMYGETVAPNEAYLAAKQEINGARIGPAAGSFEQYVAENRLALEAGEVTMDDLRTEWESEQQKTTPEGAAVNGYNAPRYEVSALTAETDDQRVQRLTSDAMQITRAKQDSGKAFDLGRLKNIRATDATKYLMPILQKLGITGRSYDNAALDISFEYSNNGAKRSIEHQSRDVGQDYRGFAIVQNNLEDLCKNAYPIEAHLDEKPKTEDSHVTQVATLGSVLETAEGYIPVRMSVKFYDNEAPKLHVIINELTPLSDVWTPEAHSTSGSEPATISVADYFRIVNNNEEFLKRVPDALRPLYLGDDSAAVQEDMAQTRGAADSLTAEEPLYLEDPADLGLGDDGLGAADAGSVNTDYDRLQAQSDKFHPSGPDPVRHTDVPTTNFEGRNIPKSTSTIYGAQGTPDAAVMQLEQMIADGKLAFDTITDKDAVASARATMEGKGFEGALEQYRNTVASNSVSKNNTALGQQLLLQAMREGNTAATAELLTLYTRNSTNTAQALQAESIFRKLSPEGQLTAVQKAIDSFNEKHDTDVQMSEEDISDFVNAESEEEREAVRQRILENVASAVPGTFKAKYDAIRYLAMLGNPRTHIRNILGNTLFQAPVTVKNRVGAVEEIIANALSGGKVERTKSLTGVNPFGSLAKEARADFDNVKELLGQTHKYIDGQTSLYDIEEKIKAFSDGNFLGRGMNALADGNSYLLEAEDTMAKKFIYTQSLAGYLKANGVKTMQGLADTLEGRQLLDRARNYAAQEAMRNTFNDKNAASDAVAKLGGLYRSENPVERGFGYVVEGVLPFKRTPTNILMRALEYSPAGAASGIIKTIQGAKAGDSVKVTQGLDRIASGMTGTGLMYLGAVLAGAGLVRGGADDDDDKQAKFDDLRGHQNYSVELSDGTSVTLDWLAPEAIPFFMGVELYKAALDGGVSFEDFQKTFRDATAPMLEMSMLQGLNNTFDNAAYAKNSGGSVAGAVLTSALTSYITQVFPTLFGQAERSFGESERMATYTDKNSSVPSDLQYTLGKVSQKIPGWDYNQIPYIDAWGRTESTGGNGRRAVNNFLNPAFISQVSDDAVEDELQRLYDATGEAGVLPQRATKYFTADGERKDLTGEEYVAYATEKGQLSRELISEFLGSAGYAQMDDAARAKAISELYSYANAKAKESVFGIGLNSSAAKIEAAVESGISPAQYFTFNAKLDALTPLDGSKGVSDMQRFRVIAGEDMGDDEKLAAIGSIMGTDMTTEGGGKSTYAKMLDTLDSGATLDQYLDLSEAGAVDSYLKYQSVQGDRDYGIEPEAFAQFQTGKSQYDADGNNSYTQKEVAAAIEGIFGDTLTAEQKAVIWQLCNKSWKAKNNPYSSEIGGLIYDGLHAAPTEEPLYLEAP